MNKLIEELAQQAGFNEYMLENLWAHEQPEFYKLVEHFAELIVLECAEMFEGVYTDTHPSERIDTRIKKDFGVE